MSSSIIMKGLGERTFETKLIQRLNDQYKHKSRKPKKSYDQTSFENVEENVSHNNLAQKISLVNISKELFFEMIKSITHGDAAIIEGSQTKTPCDALLIRCQSQPEIRFEGEMYAEDELQLGQDYELNINASLPRMATNSHFLKFRGGAETAASTAFKPLNIVRT